MKKSKGAVIEVEATPAEVEETKAILTGEKRVTIVIDENDGEEGRSDVFLAVNGKTFLMQRGVNVTVPEYVVHALKNCITTTMRQDPRTDEITYKDVPRFPFHVVNT
jgi:hypothetical protein